MSDVIQHKVIDTYKEHENFHQRYHADCSSCFTENLVLQEERKKQFERALQDMSIRRHLTGDYE